VRLISVTGKINQPSAGIIHVHAIHRSQDSSVSLVTTYRLDDRDSITDRGKEFFLRHRLKTGTGAHSASYPMGIRYFSSG